DLYSQSLISLGNGSPIGPEWKELETASHPAAPLPAAKSQRQYPGQGHCHKPSGKKCFQGSAVTPGHSPPFQIHHQTKQHNRQYQDIKPGRRHLCCIGFYKFFQYHTALPFPVLSAFSFSPVSQNDSAYLVLSSFISSIAHSASL